MSIPIWVKIASADAESVTSMWCDPSLKTMDELKEMVKVKGSRRCEHIDAPDLVIRGADSAMIEEDTPLSGREEGRSKAR